jgi:hypothetical protein
LLSSRAPDKYIRPVITVVIFASGLKYVGLGTTALGWVLCAVLFAWGAMWLAYRRPGRVVAEAERAVGRAPSGPGASAGTGGSALPEPALESALQFPDAAIEGPRPRPDGVGPVTDL